LQHVQNLTHNATDLIDQDYTHYNENYFSNIMVTSFCGGRSLERTTDHGQATGKFDHLWLRIECTLFCNSQTIFALVLWEEQRLNRF
jgi:hypothetical protein